MYEVLKNVRNGLNEQNQTLTYGTLDECRAYLRGYVTATQNFEGYEMTFTDKNFPFGVIMRSPLVSAPEITMFIARSVSEGIAGAL